MSTIKIGIGLLVIAVAVVVLIFSFRKFVFPALSDFGKATGDAFSSASKGFEDFFNSFENETSGFKQTEAPAEFLNAPTNTEFDKQIKALDPNSPTANQDALQIARDNGITGADSITVLPNGGLIITQNDKPDKPFELFPSAFADSLPPVQEPIFVNQASIDINRQVVDLLNPSSKTKPQEKIVESKPQGSTTIQGTVINRIGTEQQFQAFSSDSSKPVRGSINPTPPNRAKLLVDSKKVPIETASERANRVFIETGDFADVNRGATSTKLRQPFEFGSNTGSGSKLPTVNIGGTTGSSAGDKIVAERIAQLKKIEEQKALSVFNAGAISNF